MKPAVPLWKASYASWVQLCRTMGWGSKKGDSEVKAHAFGKGGSRDPLVDFQETRIISKVS